MEMKKEYIAKPVLSRNSILLVTLIVSAMTAGNLWLHRGDPQVGYARYDGFGFTLDYSQLTIFNENGFGAQEPNDSGGAVQVSLQGNGLEQYGLLWIASTNIPPHLRSLEGSIDYAFGLAEMEGTIISDRGAYSSVVHNSHDMIYQTFNVVEQGFAIPGIMGAGYCEETGRYIHFYYLYLPDLENPTVDSQQLERGWIGYLDGLKCHGSM